MEKQENKNICAKCGGYCCKKCGCDYFISDIESFKIDELEKLLSTGHVSIVAAIKFHSHPNGKISATPFLYLRERNVGRDIIDLLSMKTTCASLIEDHCYHNLDKRPSGGATLIPKENMECYDSVNRLEELLKWTPYQKVLKRLVKRLTGLTVPAKLSSDVEQLFFDCLNKNYQNVSEMEILDIQKMIPNLIKSFPYEYKNAYIKYKNQPSKKLLPNK